MFVECTLTLSHVHQDEDGLGRNRRLPGGSSAADVVMSPRHGPTPTNLHPPEVEIGHQEVDPLVDMFGQRADHAGPPGPTSPQRHQ